MRSDLAMDILSDSSLAGRPIQCVEMHTTGEPTRIIINGYPELDGTLLQQRQLAQEKHDSLRRRLILEPRGHFDMYGAILRPHTELTATGEAHMGVLFVHNEGYSTMCGHATIALGRFLLDTHDLDVFPRRNEIVCDVKTATAQVNLHAPCGLIQVTVPTSADGTRSDPTRPVSFASVPSFATALETDIQIPQDLAWPELGGRNHVRLSIAYGGAFYCLVTPAQLGFAADSLRKNPNIKGLSLATKKVKAAIVRNPLYRTFTTHPDHDELSFAYGVIVVDRNYGKPLGPSRDADTGLCFFADQEIDRSPTGSAVAARVALAFAEGSLSYGDSWTYHSLVSNSRNGEGGFIGTALQLGSQTVASNDLPFPSIRVRVEGFAFYTGFHTFVVEKEDPVGDDGFILDQLTA